MWPATTSLALLAVSLALAVGCSDAEKRKWKRRTAEQNYAAALDAGNADIRRDAVVRIGEAGYYASDEAYAVLDAAARTDPAPQVRCIAIRTLGRYGDERPVRTMLTILMSAGPGGEALAPTDDVRWEAARALLELHRGGRLTAQEQDSACGLYLQFLREDRSRNVRIVATQALGAFKERRVLAPLIGALRNEDFMIADTAERSLMALTGTTHDYDADAWTKWLEATADPFAHAGEPVATTQPAGPSWWDQQQRLWRKTFKLGGVD
ncbi:MAG: HEAT repeat domain-containing protein [Planctomycetes bacterium]|nr:HEAT repeat domain-containing protein [Planctomycetota bacterium]